MLDGAFEGFGNLHDNSAWLNDNNPYESPIRRMIREVVMQIIP